jgi:hypothetical protein
MASNLFKDATGATLSRSATFTFSYSPVGVFADKWAIVGRPGNVRPQVGGINRGREVWSVKIVERERQIDDDVRAEWKEAGISGEPLTCEVWVEIPGSESPSVADVAKAFDLACESLATKYGLQKSEIVVKP